MKCLVCGKEHNAQKCPLCGFPVVHIMTNDKEGLKALRPTIEAHRAEFAKKMMLSLLIYDYEVDKQVDFKGTAKIPLGRVDALSQHPIWLEKEFTNMAQRKTIPVTLCVDIDNQPPYQITVNLENIPSETIQVGVAAEPLTAEPPLQFRFMIKDSQGHSVASEPQTMIQ